MKEDWDIFSCSIELFLKLFVHVWVAITTGLVVKEIHLQVE